MEDTDRRNTHLTNISGKMQTLHRHERIQTEGSTALRPSGHSGVKKSLNHNYEFTWAQALEVCVCQYLCDDQFR